MALRVVSAKLYTLSCRVLGSVGLRDFSTTNSMSKPEMSRPVWASALNVPVMGSWVLSSNPIVNEIDRVKSCTPWACAMALLRPSTTLHQVTGEPRRFVFGRRREEVSRRDVDQEASLLVAQLPDGWGVVVGGAHRHDEQFPWRCAPEGLHERVVGDELHPDDVVGAPVGRADGEVVARLAVVILERQKVGRTIEDGDLGPEP